jgi:hypothetical protein
MRTANNVHQRTLSSSLDRAAHLIDALAGPEDRLWPVHRWPAMRFEGGLPVGELALGAQGGHGPIRYVLSAYEPGRLAAFTFRGMAGFEGHHAVTLRSCGAEACLLRHELCAHLSGAMRVAFPLVIEPLHDALITDALDRAQSVDARQLSPSIRTRRQLLAALA